MDRIEQLADFLEHEANGVLYTWNDFCRSRSDKSEDQIYNMGEFDEMCNGLTPTRIAEIVDNTDFSIHDNYYKESIYGLESSDDVSELMTCNFFEVAEDILEHPENYHDKRLKEFLKLSAEDKFTDNIPDYNEKCRCCIYWRGTIEDCIHESGDLCISANNVYFEDARR